MSGDRGWARELFLLTVAILFLEMAAIRWLNASIPVLSYFNNLILISCFLALGVGCLLARRRLTLLPFFSGGLPAGGASRRWAAPARAFGSNPLGVVVGGALEYTSNVSGLNALYLLAAALYLGSFFVGPTTAARK